MWLSSVMRPGPRRVLLMRNMHPQVSSMSVPSIFVPVPELPLCALAACDL